MTEAIPTEFYVVLRPQSTLWVIPKFAEQI